MKSSPPIPFVRSPASAHLATSDERRATADLVGRFRAGWTDVSKESRVALLSPLALCSEHSVWSELANNFGRMRLIIAEKRSWFGSRGRGAASCGSCAPTKTRTEGESGGFSSGSVLGAKINWRKSAQRTCSLQEAEKRKALGVEARLIENSPPECNLRAKIRIRGLCGTFPAAVPAAPRRSRKPVHFRSRLASTGRCTTRCLSARV